MFTRDEEKLSDGRNSTGLGSDGVPEKRTNKQVTHNGAYVGVSTPFGKGNVRSKGVDRPTTPQDTTSKKKGKRDKNDEVRIV